ncbi:winged helix-turn-helix transcriptional regulator [Haladaptatus sp. CMSO5]|uniref:winged helix-turn-helix transcriptional regulator n=1 Tax=Haladaptatus sp. CMSO5 TaxID=3120514 RepID=UPI002FCE5770
MTVTDDRVRVWVLGTIVVAVALVLSPMAVTALPDDPLSGTTNTTDTTNTTLDTSTETLTDTPTTTLDANTETLTSTATLSTTLDSTDSTTETTTSSTTSTDTVTDEVSAPTPTPTETVDGVESTVEDTATNVVEDVSDGTTTESVDTGDATSELSATTDTLTDGSTDAADTVVETVESTTTATVSVETTATTDLTATTETTVTETAVTTDTVASNPTNTVTETLATDTTTTTEAVVAETAETTDGVVETTTEQTVSETQETDADEAQTSNTTATQKADSSGDANAEAVAGSTADSERQSKQSAAETPSDDNATALLPPFSTGSLPEPVPEEPGIALGVGALVTAGAVRYGPAIDWSSFSHVATQASPSAITSRLSAGIERITRIIAPFRYSRFDDSDPLEHEGRDAVYSAISESPGIYLSAVADRADVPLSTARHHLRVLEDEKLISGVKIRGKRRFYAAHTESHELAAALNDEATAAVLDALSRLGPSSVSALAADLGRDPSTVTHHLQRLEADDIVVREREGRAVVTRLSPEAYAALHPEPEPAPSARIMADGSGVEEGLDQ